MPFEGSEYETCSYVAFYLSIPLKQVVSFCSDRSLLLFHFIGVANNVFICLKILKSLLTDNNLMLYQSSPPTIRVQPDGVTQLLTIHHWWWCVMCVYHYVINKYNCALKCIIHSLNSNELYEQNKRSQSSNTRSIHTFNKP